MNDETFDDKSLTNEDINKPFDPEEGVDGAEKLGQRSNFTPADGGEPKPGSGGGGGR